MSGAPFDMKSAIAVSVSFLFAIWAASQASAGPTGDARRLLDEAAKHFGAGGVGASSLTTVARVDGPNGAYTTEVRSGLGGELYYSQKKEDGEVLVAMHGGVLSVRGERGEFNPADEQTTAFISSHAFHWNILHASELFGDVKAGKTVEFARERAVPITANGPGGWPITFYLRARDSLPLGVTILADGREDPIAIYYQDWIEFGGIRAFSRLTIVDGSDVYAYQFVRIDFGTLGENGFQFPASE